MKTFTVKYVSSAFDTAFASMDAALTARESDLHEGYYYCETIDSFVKVFGRARLEAFEAIARKNPRSVYELARFLEKDESNVLRDVRALEAIGVVRLVESENGALRPEALYDRVVFEYDLKLDRDPAAAS